MTKGNAMTRTSTLLLILAGATAVSGCGTLGQLKTIGKPGRTRTGRVPQDAPVGTWGTGAACKGCSGFSRFEAARSA